MKLVALEEKIATRVIAALASLVPQTSLLLQFFLLVPQASLLLQNSLFAPSYENNHCVSVWDGEFEAISLVVARARQVLK